MKNLKRISLMIWSLMLAMPMYACAGSGDSPASNSVEESSQPQENIGEFAATAENVKLVGRTYMKDDTLWLSYSGSGVEFSVSGTKADITIVGDDGALSGNNLARIAIYVDGERVIDDMIDAAQKNYVLFDGSDQRTADVKVIKLSECAMSSCGIGKINVEGSAAIKPAEDKELFIEFVGDSITCGYGVDDEDKSHSFSTTTEDVTKAYAYKTAELLGADYSMVSISGYGVVSGYTTDGNKVSAQTIPQYYDKFGFSYNSFDGTKPDSVQWSFDGRKPDVVVVNLGTNDSSYCGGSVVKSEEFAQGYIDFLKVIREKNPDASIVCAFGIMGTSLYQYIEYATVLYTEETGDANVFAYQLSPQDGTLGYAADWHPTEATHEKAANELSEFLSQNVLN